MKTILICLLLVSSAFCLLTDDDLINHRRIVEKVNSDPKSTWRAGFNERLVDITVLDMKKMLGVRDMHWSDAQNVGYHVTQNDIPSQFDSREQWPGCAAYIRDQGKCGSCWAFGATEALQDRFCIAGENVTLSTEDIVSCDRYDGGCNGGNVGSAWNYLQEEGIVTEKCYPYEIPGCHHPCGAVLPTPRCRTNHTCDDGSPFSDSKHYAASSYSVGPDSNEIATELYKNGPIEAAFAVYEDFPSYKSGVYQHKTGSLLGFHAIKIIGYGVEGGVSYWLVANSWNTSWGDKGFFKIKQGDCGINDSCGAGAIKPFKG